MLNTLRKRLNEHRLRIIAKEANGNVLDVGSSAIQNKYLDPQKTVGIDLKVPAKSLYKIVQSDLNKKIPFEDNRFDTVTAGEILEHLENPSFTLREIYRVLKKDGSIIVTIPNGWLDMLMMYLGKSQEHIIIFCPNLLKRLLKKAGFKNIKFKRITKWYFFRATKKV